MKTIFIKGIYSNWSADGMMYRLGRKYLYFIKEREDGYFEMAFCDKDGNIDPNSPTVIMSPMLKDYGDVICVD